jgi:3-oxoacyl-[acyl-carrier-protein] synthase-3
LLGSDRNLDTVLIAHGSKPVGPRRYRHPVTINGDGGIAFLMRRQGRPEIVDIMLESDGAFWDLYRVEFKNRPFEDWVEECKSLRTYSFKLAIESRNRFRAMNDALLERNGVGYPDIKHYLMQNLSMAAFQFYEEAFGFLFAKACRANLEAYGHLGSVDIILNLKTGIDTGEFAEGDLALVMNNSPVAAWSSMLVRI